MNILVIDDETYALQSIENAIEEAAPYATVKMYTTAAAAMTEIQENNFFPDVVFLDIELSDMNGIMLSKQIKDICPKTNIVFVTAYMEYAMQAMQARPSGYILKPATAEKVRNELQNLRYPIERVNQGNFRVQCFGNFEVYINQKPVLFSYRKTKELFAYLIDRKGASCNTETLCAVLWEDQTDLENQKKYLRKLIADLSHTLEALGVGDVFLKRRNCFAVDVEKIDCDYYRMLKGDISAISQYTGEYMDQYDWAVMDLLSFPKHA